ncbi:unnamed protein product [Blepharisma stoltei]|uniref:Uncharacterized protein n=1 Tax=Blepharisma stoltei TaxID=1481888 RepID=A0AAU9JRV0_9CILI|nr:unnamed protein product [Blepharisma stoltei]
MDSSLQDILKLAFNELIKDDLNKLAKQQIELLNLQNEEIASHLQSELRKVGNNKRKQTLVDCLTSTVLWRLYHSFN